MTRWTARELADEVAKRQIVPKIFVSYVRQVLRNVDLRPHRVKGWCFTTENDDALFPEQAIAVCETYLEAPSMASEGVRERGPLERSGYQMSFQMEKVLDEGNCEPIRGLLECNWHGVAGKMRLEPTEGAQLPRADPDRPCQSVAASDHSEVHAEILPIGQIQMNTDLARAAGDLVGPRFDFGPRGPFFPLSEQLLDLLGVLVGDVLQFRAVGLHVVEFPGKVLDLATGIPLANQFPVAVTNRAIEVMLEVKSIGTLQRLARKRRSQTHAFDRNDLVLAKLLRVDPAGQVDTGCHDVNHVAWLMLQLAVARRINTLGPVHN